MSNKQTLETDVKMTSSFSWNLFFWFKWQQITSYMKYVFFWLLKRRIKQYNPTSNAISMQPDNETAKQMSTWHQCNRFCLLGWHCMQELEVACLKGKPYRITKGHYILHLTAIPFKDLSYSSLFNLLHLTTTKTNFMKITNHQQQWRQ